MAHQQVWDDVRARLAKTPVTGISWPNETFQEPDPTVLTSSWIAVEIASENYEVMDLGAGHWAEEGSIYVHIFVISGTGIALQTQIETFVASAFANPVQPTTVLVYRKIDLGMGVSSPDGGNWYNSTVIINYHYEMQETS